MKSILFTSTTALLLMAAACSSSPTVSTGQGGAPGSGGSNNTGGSSPTGSGGTSTGGTTGEGGTGANTGGSTGTGGIVVSGTGGSGTGGNGATGGTTGSGGSGSGGAAGAGTTGSGGGTATGGSAGASSPPAITSTMFGPFDDSFMITPCEDSGTGHDCQNFPTAGSNSCPTQPWKYGSVTTTEGTGNTYDEVFTVDGGDPNKVYDVTVHVLGQAEGRGYTGGKRSLTANVDPSAATNDLLYTGGQPGTTHVDYNVFQLVITAPAGATPIPNSPPTYFAFNAVDSSHEGNHYNYGLDETFTMKVKSGYTITLTSHDSNCVAIMNCGPGGPYNYASGALCAANARTTPASVTLPATFRGKPISNPTKFQTQFLNFKVTSITAE